jgi:hypothetical protein
MKRLTVAVFVTLLALLMAGPSSAYVYQDNFETPWSPSNYAPGWDNEGYRWGDAPIATMQQTTTHYGSGNYGVKVTADSTPGGWEWWAVVYNTNIIHSAMAKQYDPYIKVMYYDDLGANKGGQLYAVPDWVVPDDWTDTQFGSRWNRSDNYYFVPGGSPTDGPWQSTGVARTEGWHELKMQLSSSDGYIHFFLDGVDVGHNNRNDLQNLDTGMLSVMFLPSTIGDKPFVIYDNFEAGSTSTVPLPGTVVLLGSGLAGLAFWRKRRAIFKG